MNKEEERTTRVTRGALRRRSVDLDTSAGTGTPKKPAVGKKLAVLDAIQEGMNGSAVSVTDDDTTTRSTRSRKDTPSVTIKTNQKVRDREEQTGRRSRAASLSEENLALLDASMEVRRTPQRRPSEDVAATPKTAPQSNRRVTRRNSATSDDLPSLTTPTLPRSRLSVAPPTIAEDDEKEDTANCSAEADLSDLDIRKLRNRSISNSPVPRNITPPCKNTSTSSQNDNTSPIKQENVDIADTLASPQNNETSINSNTSAKELKVLVTDISNEEVQTHNTSSSAQKDTLNRTDEAITPIKGTNSSQQQTVTSSSNKLLVRNVTFDEQTTSDCQDHSSYPKTPIVAADKKALRFNVKRADSGDDPAVPKSTSDMFEIAETDTESPTMEDTTRKVESENVASSQPSNVTKDPIGEQLDTSVDASLANIVDDVKENLKQVDLSMSILETPRKPEKPKSRFPRLREGSSSTPVPSPLVGSPKKSLQVIESPKALDNETPEADKCDDQVNDSKLAKSWSHAVKGTSGQGIDVFSVRKQEEQDRRDEEAHKLNESLKRKSLETSKKIEHDEEEESETSRRNSLVDDEAMEADGYQSGDSLDSETRAEMEDNEIPVDGESIGSQDSEKSADIDEDGEEEENENDSFIVTDEEDSNLLDGSGDDLAINEEPVSSNKRRRIIQPVDSSDDENQDTGKEAADINLDKSNTASNDNVSTVQVNSSTEYSENDSVGEVKSPQISPEKSVSQSPVIKKSNADNHVNHSGESPKSRKSLPTPALISADFYASASKKAKRNTINPMIPEDTAPEKPTKLETNRKSPGLVANPAAMAQARKNKRLSLDPTTSANKSDKRSSLPSKLPQDKDVSSPLKRKTDKSVSKEPNAVPEAVEEVLAEADEEVSAEADKEDSAEVEPMEVDDCLEESTHSEMEKVVKIAMKKPKDITEFDHDTILSRCNEIVRADKERKKQSATLRQKKKDEKRLLREQQQLDDSTEVNDKSMEQPKKKKKKKLVNYLLEELGETKEQQLARALQRKVALLEAKRERKKAKKAAKLQQQLNKENQNGHLKEGIGAKFEKKAKKQKTEKATKLAKVLANIPAVPIIKRDVSAFAVYSAQIEELKEEQNLGKRKRKQKREKNQTQSAAEEVQMAFQPDPIQVKKKKKPNNDSEETTKPESSCESASASKAEEKHTKTKKTEKSVKKSKQNEHEQLNKSKQLATASSEPREKLLKSKGKPLTQAETAPLETVLLDETLVKLKESLSEPITKVVKKQKLSQKEVASVRQFTELESTPPRKTTGGSKLKALRYLESGFTEEPVTPEQQLLKRNRGFKEEPVTPKPIGFRVSSLLPAGQEELRIQAIEAKKKNKLIHPHRIRPEDVVEPAKTLPLPIWTRSGTFEVEEVSAKGQKKKTTKSSDGNCIPVSGSGKTSTNFLVKPLASIKHKSSSMTRRVELAEVEQDVINFKKQAIHVKNAHLREKKSKL
ncbi:protein slender lobes-like [Topomyia yanbarensis]|uniref:protein slender lobes-like n=1 Tax=Topomyia yanbarensis TaxID=2498891 RepID=UPI00273BDBBF|nr:protein slender lobes-like [Topomyia yanbarensis]